MELYALHSPLPTNQTKSCCRYFHCAAHNLDLANGSGACAAGKTSDAAGKCDGGGYIIMPVSVTLCSRPKHSRVHCNSILVIGFDADLVNKL